MSSSNYSVMYEVNKTEEAIKTTYERIHTLEQKLQNESIPEKKQNEIERELKEVRKLLETHESQLAHLRTHNRQTFVIAAGFIFIVFVLYMAYVLIRNASS